LWFVIIPEEIYRLGRPMSEVKRSEHPRAGIAARGALALRRARL
jgi:hypothetical protein